MTRSAQSLWITGLTTSDVKTHLVEKQDSLNWDAQSVQKQLGRVTVLSFFRKLYFFNVFVCFKLMPPIFMPDDFNVSDVNARHKNGYL